MDHITAIVVAVIGSSALTTLVQAVMQRRYEARRNDDLTKKTLAAVSYWVLSNELEKLLSRGWASPEERRTIGILFDAYRANGWNGDMDARMERLMHMPTAQIANNMDGSDPATGR